MTWVVAEGTVDGDDGVRAENAGRAGLLHDEQCIHRVQSHSFEERRVDDGVEEEEDLFGVGVRSLGAYTEVPPNRHQSCPGRDQSPSR